MKKGTLTVPFTFPDKKRQFVEISGHHFRIDWGGFDQFEFFVHRPVRYDREAKTVIEDKKAGWVVSEKSTGAIVCREVPVRRDVSLHLEAFLEFHNITPVQLERAIKQNKRDNK